MLGDGDSGRETTSNTGCFTVVVGPDDDGGMGALMGDMRDQLHNRFRLDCPKPVFSQI